MRPLVALAVVASLVGTASATPPSQVAALKRKIAGQAILIRGLRQENRSLKDQLQATQYELTKTQSALADAQSKLALSAKPPLDQIEAMDYNDIFHSLLPGLVAYFNERFSAFGHYSTYQSGAYLSYTLTCFRCG